VVWVGYDDNSSTQLTGARGALPLWARFTAAVRPAAGFPDFPMPAGMVRVTVDPVTGQLATPYCPNQVTDLFPEWKAPTVPCERHSPGYNGDALADVTLSQPPIDPAATEEPGSTVTPDGLEIVRPVGAAATTTPGGGSIVIRPTSRPRPDAPAGATGGPAGMEPSAGVVPVGSGPVGAKAAPATPPPAEPAPEPEETPPG
jgi:membrane peptidoglycan carboxypeptidase